jgi:hypothetical protein
MSDKKLGRIYKSLITNVTKRTKKQQNCMKRATNNPDYIYMLGNKCIKPVIKSRKIIRHRKVSNKRVKKGRNQKSRRVKYRQKGGGLYGNIANSVNDFKSGILEEPRSQNVLPWEGNFAQKYESVV